MASSPGSGGFRHAGRIVDPSVRDDGEQEPKVELADDATRDSPRDSGEEPIEQGQGAQARHPVRDRLLAKAAQARQRQELESSTQGHELDAVGRAEPRPDVEQVSSELVDEGPRAPAAPLPARGMRQLSPNLIFAFGTLMGIFVVLSLIALVVNLEPGARAVPSKAPVIASSEAPPVEAPKARPKRFRNKIPGPWRIQDSRGDAALRTVEGKIGTDSFLKAVSKAGVPEREVYRILIAMKGLRDFDKCGKNDRFIALLERGSSKLKAFEYLVGPEEIYQAREGSDGFLKGAALDLKVERAQVSGVLVYDGKSFDASAELGGFDPGLAKVVARALDGHGSLDELEPNTILRVIAQEITVLGEFARYAGVEALELRPPDPKKEPMRLYYHDVAGMRGYYDKQGRAPYEGGWRKPVKDAPITSPFNMKRLHPVLKKVMPHQGTDFGAPTGTPVGASSFGTVTFVGWGGPAGNLVKIMHPGGIETGYFHLSRFREGLKVGDKVKRLEVIGYVGSTGRSTGPHLHFSASRDGKYFDAETLNLDGMRALSKDERVGFAPVMAKYDALLDALPLPSVPAPAPAAPASATPQNPTAQAISVDPFAADEGEDEPGAAAPPGTPPPAPVPGPAPKSGSAVYLTDKELLEMQSATDDGEVSD